MNIVKADAQETSNQVTVTVSEKGAAKGKVELQTGAGIPAGEPILSAASGQCQEKPGQAKLC